MLRRASLLVGARPFIRRESAVWALAGLLVVGCSGFTDVVRLRLGGKVRVEVVTTPKLNRDFPAPVED